LQSAFLGGAEGALNAPTPDPERRLKSARGQAC
jgi:hypothetical protein